MNNCICELPQLENPFDINDIFCDEDWKLMYEYDEATKNTHGDKIMWYDARKDFFTGKKEKQKFNGIGHVTDKKLMRMMRDFLHDNFHPDFIKEMWGSNVGHKYFPCTLLAWSEGSQWHREGIALDVHKNFNIYAGRFSTVCNFRLLGDENDCSIKFAEGSEELESVCETINQDYVDRILAAEEEERIEFSHSLAKGLDIDVRDEFMQQLNSIEGGYNKGTDTETLIKKMYSYYIGSTKNKAKSDNGAGLLHGVKPRQMDIDKSIMTNAANEWIIDDEKWEPHLTPIMEKQGFREPFILNLSKWHRVCIKENASRVTLRFMADKTIPFKRWEEMVDNGTFLK